LYSINPGTGAATLIGPTGLNSNVGGPPTIGLSAGSPTLYISYGNSYSSATLYSVNTTTGAATPIGSTGADGIGAVVLVNGTLYGGSNWQGTTQADTVTVLNPATGAGVLAASVSGGATQFYGLAPFNQIYYFSQLALGGGWQTTLTYINYSTSTITCTTNFVSDSGAPLSVPFSGGAVSTRTDTLQAGQSLHDQSQADLNAPVVEGWAQAICNGPIQASLLYRLYQQGAPVGEAGVNAMTAPATKFVTFAQTKTGVAYGNPSSTQSAVVTFTVVSAGTKLGSANLTLPPLCHGAANLGPLLGLADFVGFVEITSSVPIISLSLNAEAYPVFSSLPPGELSGSTPLVFQ